MNKHTVRMVSFGSLFALGLMMSAVGPALPDLADQVGEKLAALGGIVSAMFGGSLAALIVAGPLSDRIGPRPLLLGGVALAAISMAVMLLSQTLWLTLGAAVTLGMGFGAIEVCTNLLIAQVFADNSVSLLNLLHVFFGIGAVSGPALASGSIRLWDTALPVLWLGTFVAIAMLPLIWRLASGPVHTKKETARLPERFNYAVPMLWVLGVLLLVYVGVETGIGTWTTTYIERSTDLIKADGALVTSGFWLALTIGRVAAALWGGQFTGQRLLRDVLIGALVGGVFFALGSGTAVITIVSVLVVGLCFGPVYPTVISITTTTFPQGAGKAASVVTSLGSVGGATLPWFMGVLLNDVSSATYALFVGIGITVQVGLFTLVMVYRVREHMPSAAPEHV